MEQDKLRQEIRIIKAIKKVSYKIIAEQLNIKYKSFLNWLSGQYNFSFKTTNQLKEIILKFKEE